MVCDSINVLRQLNNFGRRDKQEYYEEKKQKIKEFCKLIPKDPTKDIGNFEENDLIYTFAKGYDILEPTKTPKGHEWKAEELRAALEFEMKIMQYLMKKHKNRRAKAFYYRTFCNTFNKFVQAIGKEKKDMIEYSQYEQNKINKNNDEQVREYVFSHTYLPEISEKLQVLKQEYSIYNSNDWKQMILSEQNKQKVETGDKESNQVITIPHCLKSIYHTVRTITEKEFCESLPKDSNEFKTKLQDYKKSLDGITLEGDNTRRGKHMQTMQNCIECLLYLIVNRKHSKFQNMADLFGQEIDWMMRDLGYNNKNNQKSTYNKNNEEEKANGLS